MATAPLDLAFSRLGADAKGRQRRLCATAQDGSLVLVCQSSGFSRPGTGVLRYSARLSTIAARTSQIKTLRLGLEAATSAGTPVRLIIQTPGVGRSASRVHLRPDLVGSVAEYDGDAYCVDFVRIPAAEATTPSRGRPKR